MKRISIIFLVMTVVVSGLGAQYGFLLDNNLFLTEDPNITPFGTLEFEPARTIFSFGSDDSTSYSAYSIYNNLRFNLADFADLAVSVPFNVDRFERNSAAYFSRGWGDLLLSMKYSLALNEQFSLAFSPYLSIPFGRTRKLPLDSLKPDTLFEGGILRDFTTTSYDYGVKFIAGFNRGGLNLNFNYGYFAAYRHQLTSSPPDFHLIGLSVLYKYRIFNPFVELGLGVYSRKTFGNAPSYASIGTGIELLPFLDAKFSVALPLEKKEPIDLVAPEVNTSYPGFLSGFVNYPENVVLSLGLKFKNIVYNRRATSRVTVIIRDRSTQEFVQNCRVKIGSREFFAGSGVVHIPSIKAGVQQLQVESDGYVSVDKFVEIEGNTSTRIEINLVRAKVPVLISVRNSRMEPINSAVALVSVEEGTNTILADERGLITYIMDRSTPLSFYISAPGFIGDNFYIDPSLDRDTVKINIVLKEEKDEVAVLPIIYFDVGSYRIRKEFFPFLDIVGRYLVNHPDYRLEIIGHASAEGPEKYNQVLSLKRAEECKKHLILRYKIDSERITAKGFGKDVPAVPNRTEYQRSINRRAEFKLIPPVK